MAGLVMCTGCGARVDPEAVFCPQCAVRRIPKSEHALVGETIGGRYRLLVPFGDRDGGVAYVADDLSHPGTRVVAKTLEEPDTLPLERLRDEGAALRARADARMAALRDFGRRSNGSFFLVLELPPGEALSARSGRGPMAADEAARLLEELAGLVAASSSSPRLRRDLRPTHIFLDQGRIGWVDFQLAKAVERLAGLSPKLDDPRYVAPEQSRTGQGSPEAEVFALGVLGYELLVGKAPLMRGATPLAEARPDAPEWLVSALEAARAADPAARPPTPEALASKLRGAHGHGARGEIASSRTAPARIPRVEPRVIAEDSLELRAPEPPRLDVSRSSPPIEQSQEVRQATREEPAADALVAALRSARRAHSRDDDKQEKKRPRRSKLPLIIGAWGGIAALGLGLFLLRDKLSGGPAPVRADAAVRPTGPDGPPKAPKPLDMPEMAGAGAAPGAAGSAALLGSGGNAVAGAAGAKVPVGAAGGPAGPAPDTPDTGLLVPPLDQATIDKKDLVDMALQGEQVPPGEGEFRLTVKKGGCDKEGGCDLTALGLFEGRMIGVNIVIKPHAKTVDEDPTAYYDGGVELRSLGPVSDALLSAVANQFGVRGSRRAMRPRVQFRSGVMVGSPRKTKKMVVYRISQEIANGPYAVMELELNLSEHFVRFVETRSTNRESFITALARP